MAFKEVTDLSTENTIALGGNNKKTGKANPTKIEGYYIGRKEVEDRKKKSGKTYIHVFKTPQGNVGVWGKTDLDRKLQSITFGQMVRATQNKMIPTPNGDMYGFKVEVDADNITEVSSVPLQEAIEAHQEVVSYEPESDELEEESFDVVEPARPLAPRKPAVTPDSARVQALLAKARSKQLA